MNDIIKCLNSFKKNETKFVRNDTKLSTHFTVGEATFSSMATRHRINNDLPVELLDNAKLIANEILEPVREFFDIPFSPSSFYRSPSLNKAIRGSNKSQHLQALAVDIKIPGVHISEIAEFFLDKIYDQIILEYYDRGNPTRGWLHVSRVHNIDANRREALIFDGYNYSSYYDEK